MPVAAACVVGFMLCAWFMPVLGVGSSGGWAPICFEVLVGHLPDKPLGIAPWHQLRLLFEQMEDFWGARLNGTLLLGAAWDVC